MLNGSWMDLGSILDGTRVYLELNVKSRITIGIWMNLGCILDGSWMDLG